MRRKVWRFLQSANVPRFIWGLISTRHVAAGHRQGTGEQRVSSQLPAATRSRKSQSCLKLVQTGQHYTLRVGGSDKICTFHIHSKIMKGHLVVIFNVCMTLHRQIYLFCRLMVFPRLLLIRSINTDFYPEHIPCTWTKAM